MILQMARHFENVLMAFTDQKRKLGIGWGECKGALTLSSWTEV